MTQAPCLVVREAKQQMSDFPWENDRELFMEVMNHGRFFLNMQLFQDVRDRDQMKVGVPDCHLGKGLA